mmetsp:Transcript_14264/g.40423  ORF Transcript_14264/g.40423 Transcript_14264/m.40423 type:complete len:613 (-) Transcript_14264:331-2169(-)|eukprot:CAMPEP_0117649080 /NCGR_PEP_ID=MMETSP0804-20121206/771_1 /TAXON_ID=1074897 /ORGANISM="Tetraselmis astigmatica, Strain CCMP880" /LENGTH=612 /DNA_ID=CAMNT_0005454773 /DNA_START=440 /DNA_END=2275 /DNA_ORIENTATION=+
MLLRTGSTGDRSWGRVDYYWTSALAAAAAADDEQLSPVSEAAAQPAISSRYRGWLAGWSGSMVLMYSGCALWILTCGQPSVESVESERQILTMACVLGLFALFEMTTFGVAAAKLSFPASSSLLSAAFRRPLGLWVDTALFLLSWGALITATVYTTAAIDRELCWIVAPLCPFNSTYRPVLNAALGTALIRICQHIWAVLVSLPLLLDILILQKDAPLIPRHRLASTALSCLEDVPSVYLPRAAEILSRYLELSEASTGSFRFFAVDEDLQHTLHRLHRLVPSSGSTTQGKRYYDEWTSHEARGNALVSLSFPAVASALGFPAPAHKVQALSESMASCGLPYLLSSAIGIMRHQPVLALLSALLEAAIQALWVAMYIAYGSAMNHVMIAICSAENTARAATALAIPVAGFLALQLLQMLKDRIRSRLTGAGPDDAEVECGSAGNGSPRLPAELLLSGVLGPCVYLCAATSSMLAVSSSDALLFLLCAASNSVALRTCCLCSRPAAAKTEAEQPTAKFSVRLLDKDTEEYTPQQMWNQKWLQRAGFQVAWLLAIAVERYLNIDELTGYCGVTAQLVTAAMLIADLPDHLRLFSQASRYSTLEEVLYRYFGQVW